MTGSLPMAVSCVGHCQLWAVLSVEGRLCRGDSRRLDTGRVSPDTTTASSGPLVSAYSFCCCGGRHGVSSSPAGHPVVVLDGMFQTLLGSRPRWVACLPPAPSSYGRPLFGSGCFLCPSTSGRPSSDQVAGIIIIIISRCECVGYDLDFVGFGVY